VAVNTPLVELLGATGCVGSAVLRELARRPVRIGAVARRPARVPADARARIEVRATDLTAPGAIAEAVAGADVVIHAVRGPRRRRSGRRPETPLDEALRRTVAFCASGREEALS
jgi:uncharacterized protein YbjT (DUF2867 family)